ncbi:MAG: SDR family NAD(P)-dependent oxidoreductase [Acidimicrobiia bacterium]|nr:SDR family NAD(P)-dependent oxidoreductase [Acidimicrobiia bacterium]
MSNASVLIIGSSRGIGAGLVREFLSRGWQVHATVRDKDSPGDLEDVADRVTLHQLDVRDVSRVNELAKELADADLNVIIHNAGIYRGHPEAELIEVNSVAPIRTVQALLDSGAVAADGVVALMTSQLGARRGREGTEGGYGGSKARLNDSFRERADSWGSAGAKAVVIHPGWVRTDMGGATAPVSVEESAAGIYDLLTNLTPDQHGRFWTWDGREHPW